MPLTPVAKSSAKWSAALRRVARRRGSRVFVVRCLGAAALFGLEITLARSLGVAGYGAFSFALAVAAVAARLAPLGWLNASTRFVSAYASLASFRPLKGALILAYGATAAGVGVSALALAAGAGLTGGQDGAALWFAIPLMAALAFLELNRHVLRGLNASELGEAFLVLFLPVLVIASVWILAVRQPGDAADVYAGACAVLALASGLVIVLRIPKPVWRAAPQFHLRAWSLSALALLVGGVSTEVATRASVIVLGMLGAGPEVGLYQAAARLALVNVFVLRAITPVAAPQISALYAAGRLDELRAAFWRLCLWSLLGALPCFAFFFLFPAAALGLFGSDFRDGDTMLRVLSVGYLASAAAGPCATALMMIGRERAYAAVTFGATLASVAVNYILAQQLGGLGAAIATAGVMTLNNALYLWILIRATASPKRALVGAGAGAP